MIQALTILAIVGLVWGILREASADRRRPLALVVLLAATAVVGFIALFTVTSGWAIVLLAVLVVGLVIFSLGSGWVVLVLAVILALVLSTMATGGGSHNHNTASKKDHSSKKHQPAQPKKPVKTPHPASCLGGHRVKMDLNLEGKFKSQGIKATTSPGVRKEIYGWIATDPKGLFYYYDASPLGRVSPIRSVQELVQGGIVGDGNCYSAKGVAKFNEWAVLWKTAQIVPVASMPPGWNNSGVSNGQPHSGPPPTGNTSGWMVTFVGPNGKPTGKMGTMKRCGNPVTPPPNTPPPPSVPPPKTPPPVHRIPKCFLKLFPIVCGTNDSGPEQQPVQQHKQPPTKGYNPGNLENVQAVQPVGSPDPHKRIPPTPKGTNSGSPTGGPKGGDTTTGKVNTSGGGTHGSDQGTQASGQPTNSGDAGGPPP